MRNILVIIIFVLFPVLSSASDWGGDAAPIEIIYVYQSAVIVVQGSNYAGEAGCKNNNKWSFYWSELSPEVADRVYSMLLSAKMAKAKIKPLFDKTGCGPEGHKKFEGKFVIY